MTASAPAAARASARVPVCSAVTCDCSGRAGDTREDLVLFRGSRAHPMIDVVRPEDRARETRERVRVLIGEPSAREGGGALSGAAGGVDCLDDDAQRLGPRDRDEVALLA